MTKNVSKVFSTLNSATVSDVSDKSFYNLLLMKLWLYWLAAVCGFDPFHRFSCILLVWQKLLERENVICS